MNFFLARSNHGCFFFLSFISPRPNNVKGLLVFQSGNDCLGLTRHMTDALLACQNNHLCQWRPNMVALEQHMVADRILFICRIFGHVSHRSEWQLVKIDFRSIFNRRCTEADYQTWHLHNQVRLSILKSKFWRDRSLFLTDLRTEACFLAVFTFHWIHWITKTTIPWIRKHIHVCNLGHVDMPLMIMYYVFRNKTLNYIAPDWWNQEDTTRHQNQKSTSRTNNTIA